MFALAFLALTLLSGVLLHRVIFRAPYSWSFDALLLSLILPSFLGLILLELHFFTPNGILGAMALGDTVLLALTLRLSKRELPHQERPRNLPLLLAVVGTLLIATWFRTPSINYLRGGQDPGVYVNIANSLVRTGTVRVKDPLAEAFSRRSTELERLYFSNSYRAIRCRAPNSCSGAFFPGFYLRSIKPSVVIPQFYHLHPIWMAYSNLIGGSTAYTTTILPIFGVLSVLLFYLVLREISGSRILPVAGALILACSPAFAYFARFPVSEVTASLFFLCSLLFLVRSKFRSLPELIVAGLFATGLFLTHVTGFMLLLFLYPALLLATRQSINERERWNPLIAWCLFLVGFAWSFLHGLNYSRPYAVAIWSKIGLPNFVMKFSLTSPTTAVIGLLIVSLVPFFAVLRSHPALWDRLDQILNKRRLTQLAIVTLAVFVAFLLLQAYWLGFSDHYANHRWIGRRWHLAGQGLWSIKHMRVLILMMFVSPVMVILACVGWVRWSSESLRSPQSCFLALSCAGSAISLVGIQLIAPYLYYFGRYLVPVLMPLTVLAGIYGLELLRLRTPRQTAGMRALMIFSALAWIIPNTVIQSRVTESEGLQGELAKIASAVGPNAALFVDSVDFPRVELATSLQISFGIPTVTYSRRDYTGEKLKELMRTVADLGYEVFLISAKDRRGTLPFLKKHGAYSLSLSLFSARRGEVMPTVHNQRNQRAFVHRFLPDKI